VLCTLLIVSLFCYFFFFFFQAEDGIRDGHVTGVQTCALPIFKFCKFRCAPQPEQNGLRQDARNALVTSQKARDLVETPRGRVPRSEERRVGKEWRSRGALGHEQKKKKTKGRVQMTKASTTEYG